MHPYRSTTKQFLYSGGLPGSADELMRQSAYNNCKSAFIRCVSCWKELPETTQNASPLSFLHCIAKYDASILKIVFQNCFPWGAVNTMIWLGCTLAALLFHYLPCFLLFMITDSSTLFSFPNYHSLIFLHGWGVNCVTANMGVAEGKSIGEWFGPNTVMQVFRLVLASSVFSCLVLFGLQF